MTCRWAGEEAVRGWRGGSLLFACASLGAPCSPKWPPPSRPSAPPRATWPLPQTAFKCHVRSRDYCASGRHVLAMCLDCIRCALELGNYAHVANYVRALLVLACIS